MSFEKLKASIAYVCNHEQPEHAPLDHVKLNKVLWFSDAASYMESGQPITNGKYIRKPRGPVAKYMPSAVQSLERAGVVKTGRAFDSATSIWVHTIEVVDGLGENSRLNVEEILNQAERNLLDNSFRRVCLESSSDQISDRTHGKIWDLAADGEEIPLYAVYAEDLGRITNEDVTLAFAE